MASRSSSLRERVVDGTTEIGEWFLQRVERSVIRYSLVGTTPFLDPDQFGWVGPLEDRWQAIRRELDEVLDDWDDLPNFQDISADQASITDDDRWKTFFFYGFGFKAEANCARCPETAAALAQVPGLTTAFFSILAPHKHIPEHRGPWRGLLRYHLALRVPEPVQDAGIDVGGEVAHWREGKSLVFDDTYQHFAWNDTDGIRVVLFVDIVRPLRPPAAQFNRALLKVISLSPFIQDAKSRHREWEKRYDARPRRGLETNS
jgi:aspartyl/asparaginyl beta-hydroxylase (cupin superfamily)